MTIKTVNAKVVNEKDIYPILEKHEIEGKKYQLFLNYYNSDFLLKELNTEKDSASLWFDVPEPIERMCSTGFIDQLSVVKMTIIYYKSN